MDQSRTKKRKEQNDFLTAAWLEEMAIMESMIIGAAAVGLIGSDFKIKNRSAKIVQLKRTP